MVYNLQSVQQSRYGQSDADDNSSIPSVSKVFSSADWGRNLGLFGMLRSPDLRQFDRLWI